MLTEIDLAIRILWRKENAPAIFGHADIVELGPALGIDADRGAQIDQRLLETFRAHVVPPVEIAGMPSLQRLEHLAVLREVHIVGNLGRVIDVHDVHGGAPYWRANSE
jgi:hypothetical protein